MTKIEKRTIQEMDAKLWNELQEMCYNLVTASLPFGCGYDTASKLTENNTECNRALSRWCSVNDLMKDLNVEPDYELYSNDSHRLWMYANGKETR